MKRAFTHSTDLNGFRTLQEKKKSKVAALQSVELEGEE